MRELIVRWFGWACVRLCPWCFADMSGARLMQPTMRSFGTMYFCDSCCRFCR